MTESKNLPLVNYYTEAAAKGSGWFVGYYLGQVPGTERIRIQPIGGYRGSKPHVIEVNITNVRAEPEGSTLGQLPLPEVNS